MAHDKKLMEAIALEVDLQGAAVGSAVVRELREKVRVAYPFRKWHPYEQREAENASAEPATGRHV